MRSIKCGVYQAYKNGDCIFVTDAIADLYTAADVAYKIMNIYGVQCSLRKPRFNVYAVFMIGVNYNQFNPYHRPDIGGFLLDLTLPFPKHNFSVRQKLRRWNRNLKNEHSKFSVQDQKRMRMYKNFKYY